MKGLLAAAFVLAFSVSSSATEEDRTEDPLTVVMLASTCQSPEPLQSTCRDYIGSLWVMLSRLDYLKGGDQRWFCVPSGADIGPQEAMDAFFWWLDRHREEFMEYRANWALFTAWKAAWPCG